MKMESDLEKENKEVRVPEWETLDMEKMEMEPSVWLFISSKDQIIKNTHSF